jgi:RNA polymerase sigma factor (sigma-70 family)
VTGGRKSPRDRDEQIAELMEAHGEAVFGYCLRVIRVHALAEDVTQQVFLEAYRDLDRFAGLSSPRAWLFGIACHRCLDALKKQQRFSALIENNEEAVAAFEDPGPGPGEHVDRGQLVAALEECLGQLSPEIRATVLLRFQTGATYEEMSERLGASADTLQVRVARALPVLRRCVKKKGWTDE